MKRSKSATAPKVPKMGIFTGSLGSLQDFPYCPLIGPRLDSQLNRALPVGLLVRFNRGLTAMDSKRLTRALRALLAGDLDFGASRRRRSSRAAFFLAGAGTGVLVGMIVAPASGEKLRGDIGARAREEGFDRVRSKAPGFAGRQKTPSGETALKETAEKNVS
jgi:hypothetical protein